jgi:hypothetical protein
MSKPKYRDREGAAEYLASVWGIRRTPGYLAKLAVTGGGPVFRKARRDPLYADEDLDAFALSIIGPRMKSTSEVLQDA